MARVLHRLLTWSPPRAVLFLTVAVMVLSFVRNIGNGLPTTVVGWVWLAVQGVAIAIVVSGVRQVLCDRSRGS